MNGFTEDLLEYFHILQKIVECREADFDNWTTPYALEESRGKVHRRLFENHIFYMLEKGTDFNLAYQRSKEIFSRLDQVWKIFNADSFDLNNEQDLLILAEDMSRFLLKTEVRFYLEGVTEGIHGLDIGGLIDK